MLIDSQGRFVTGRRFPELVRVNAHLQQDGLSMRAPGMPPLTINYRQLQRSYHPVTVWDDTLQAQVGDPAWDAWFSDYLHTDCRLVYFGQQSHRLTRKGHQPVAFADGYPLLLTSMASLADLNCRLEQPIGMNRFRPNLVIDGDVPFGEDSWQRIRIGTIEFDVVKPCSRCVFTTVDPDTGRVDPGRQPLATLQNFRRNPAGEIDFGMNLIALGRGNLSRGDKLEVLAVKEPIRYPDEAPYSDPAAGLESAAVTGDASRHSVSENTARGKPQIPPATSNSQPQESPMKQITLLFDNLDTVVTGNTRENILEQAEQAGMDLPFSCRSGTCGTCRMRLISGEVEVLEDAGLSQQELDDNQILICSCIPKTDLVLNQI
jgi:uncharacterized protein YcbX/ferredoxin